MRILRLKNEGAWLQNWNAPPWKQSGCRALAEDACTLATTTNRSLYDAMYLALAVRLRCSA